MIVNLNKINVGTFSSKYIATIIEVAIENGASRKDLYEFIGESEAFIANPINRICSLKTIKLFHAAITLCGLPQLGLRIGQALKPGTFDVLGYAIMCSNTFNDAIQLNYRYQRLNQELGKTPLYFEDCNAVLEWQSEFEDQVLMRPVNETVMAGYVGLARWLSWRGEKLPIIKIEFKHDQPQYYREYEEIFGDVVEFNSFRTALHFHSEILKLPLQQADPTMVELMKFQLDSRLKQFEKRESVKSLVSCYLQSQLGKSIPTISCAAEALGYHERTLRRRLREESTNFKQILDEIRRVSATTYLKRLDMSIIDVALLLGYRDQSAFSRAFKGWFDESPGKYRDRNCSVN